MKKKQNRKFRISFLLVFILFLFVLIIKGLIVGIYEKEQEKNDQDESQIELPYIAETVTNHTKFYTIQNCIQIYLQAYIKKDNNKLQDLLPAQQDKKNDIKGKGKKVNSDLEFIATKMECLEGNQIEKYYVLGETYQQESFLSNVAFLVAIDTIHQTFFLYPIEEQEKQIQKESFFYWQIQEIPENQNNTFSYYRISEEQILRSYLAYYKKKALYDTQKAFLLLEPQYRQKRFRTVEQYIHYITDRREILQQSLLKQYQIEKREEKTIYVCQDQFGNYFILQEIAPMQYEILLDSYTVLLPEWKKRYETANTQLKSMLFFNLYLDSINQKDMDYLYEGLEESFRMSHFSSKQSLKNYINEKFFSINEVQYQNAIEQQDVVILNALLINKQDTTQTKQMQIIINSQKKIAFSI